MFNIFEFAICNGRMNSGGNKCDVYKLSRAAIKESSREKNGSK